MSLGGCKGSTGPSSLNPETGKPFGTTFPVITIRDMVNAQKLLLDYLSISELYAVDRGVDGRDADAPMDDIVSGR